MKFVFVILLLINFPALAGDKIIKIYQDADLSRHKESSEAIQKGIEVAFDEIGNEIDGYKVEFKYLDHRGNVVLSKKNYESFLADENALAIYSGIHSPPLIKNRKFINENKALTLVPWAAGGPITRYPSSENWIFRLSIDDTKAGAVIIDYAIKDQKCTKPHLLLEDSPWGNSNLASMGKAISKYNIDYHSVTRFGWNLQEESSEILINKVTEDNPDCVVLVSNAVEAVYIAKALLKIPQEKRPKLISHWGITGGEFHKKINAEQREKVNLTFIQSCFAFTNPEQTEFSKSVFERLQKLDIKMHKPESLESAVGFIHAYDLTKLLIAAIKKAGLSGDIVKDRDAVRLALENLDEPIQGLVKVYEMPFSEFDAETNFDAHEALGKENYCMARYGDSNEILVIK